MPSLFTWIDIALTRCGRMPHAVGTGDWLPAAPTVTEAPKSGSADRSRAV